MENLPKVKPSEILPFLSILQTVQDTHLVERFEVDIGARISDIQDQVKAAAQRHYETKFKEVSSAPGVNRALPMLLMTDEIEKTLKLLDKNFGEPILGYVYHWFDLMFLINLDPERSTWWLWQLTS